MNHVDWEHVRDAFEHGRGCSRQIQLRPVDGDLWQKVYVWIQREHGPIKYKVDGLIDDIEFAQSESIVNGLQTPPEKIAVLFEYSTELWMSLDFLVGKVELRTQLWGAEHTTFFELDPEQVNGPEALSSLVGFLRALARHTERAVLLTLENTKEKLPEEVILRCDPLTLDITYNQPSTLWEWTEKRGWVWRGKWDRYPPPASPPRRPS